MKVSYHLVQEQLAKVRYTTLAIPNSTTTIVAAFTHDNFYLGCGTSCCVDPAEYNAEIGLEVAMEHAKQVAENKLWELNGILLYNQLKQDSAG